jgi:putative DNA primase/helicase
VNPAQQPNVLDVALAFCDAGCSVIPVATDGTKKPLGTWKQAQQTAATPDEVRRAFADGHPGLGIVTGAVSGNLLMVELEGRAVDDGMLKQLAELAMNSGLADLWRRATSGYLERTPSGGVHLLVRVLAPVGGNLKLARRPGPPDPATGKPTVEVLAETRGEGGFVVVAPSHGPVHPSGKPWQRAVGGPATIPDLTGDEADALLTLFRSLDQMPAIEPIPHTTRPPADAPRSAADQFLLTGGTSTGGISPGDDYNTRADWAEILERHGWRLMRESNGERFWLRPGKQPAGRDDCSATTGYGDRGDWLWVFSTSTEFDTETTYSKFAAYALLEHAGNYTAAAKALKAAGYGTPPPEQPRPAAALTTDQPGQGASTPPDVPAKDTPKAATLSAAGVPAPPLGPATYSRTDDGNALRLVDGHRLELRYVPQRAQWLAWDGHRWRWDEAGRVHEHARALARALPVGTKEDDKHRAWSLSARGLNAMVRTAQTDARIATSVADLDRRPYELNTPSGVADLRTGQLRAPDPSALHTRTTSCAPTTDEPVRWLRFLADTFAGDPDITRYIQRLLGVSLIGEVLEQVLPFGFGEGANGKTTLLGVVMRIIGLGEDGYSIGAPAELLLATANAGHPTELARLAGARLVVTSELEEGQRFAEAKVKQLTGRDPVTARFMRQDFFTFTPTHSLWLLANHAPAVRAGGPAFWRRLRLLPFLHVVPPEQRDPHLEDRLVDDEGPAILGWLIQGAVDYLAHGLEEPTAVRAATSAYERDQDTVARFVEEQCVLGQAGQQGMAVKVADLRAAYETWCRTEGETAVNAKAFTLTLCSRFGVQRDRDRSTRYYAGIRLDETSDVSPADAGDEQNEWWKG